MNWYEIEYTGGKAGTVIGTCEQDLENILLSENPNKFIKVSNWSYYSKLSEQYELFENWESKWTNEILINTDKIVAVRMIDPQFKTVAMVGEFNAFQAEFSLGLILNVSHIFVEKNLERFKNDLEPQFLECVKPHRARGVVETRIAIQTVLDENEFVITSMKNIVAKGRAQNDLIKEALQEVRSYLNRFLADTDEEEEGSN